jgi:hypothetical protein
MIKKLISIYKNWSKIAEALENQKRRDKENEAWEKRERHYVYSEWNVYGMCPLSIDGACVVSCEYCHGTGVDSVPIAARNKLTAADAVANNYLRRDLRVRYPNSFEKLIKKYQEIKYPNEQ